MKEFIKLEKYGHLYIDKVLFESYFPIIFTCVNDNKDIFIMKKDASGYLEKPME